MAFYRVTITFRDNIITGIREVNSNNIDAVWRRLEFLTRQKHGDKVKRFDVVMLSRLSEDVKDWLQQSRRPPAINL